MKKSNSTKSSDLVFEIQTEGRELAISRESSHAGKKLLEKFNDDMVLPQNLDFTRSYLEEALNNTLEYNENSKVKEDAWR